MPDRSPGQDGAAAANKKNKIAPTERGEPAKKFQRVYRACSRCRAKKEKCDGRQPTCSACAAANQTCTYDSGARKRGLLPGYVRVLEMLLGSVLEARQDSEESLRIALERLCLTSENEWRLSVLEWWKSSSTVKDVERLLPTIDLPEERDISKKAEPSPRDRNRALESTMIDRRPGTERYDLARRPSNASQEHSVHTFSMATEAAQVPQMFSPERFVPVGPAKHIPTSGAIENEDSLIRTLSLPATCWGLFDIFFAHTHCWLPIVEKVDILRIAYTYPSSQPLTLSRNAPGSGTHSALWAILAYTSRQASTSVSRNHDANVMSELEWTNEQLYDVARSLIPGETAQYELGHCQALLLLALCKIGGGEWSAAWLLIGYAVRVAFALDLPAWSARGSDLMRDSHGRHKHVYFGCFILDTLISMHLNKPPHLRTEFVQPMGGIPENDLEEWEPWQAPTKLPSRFGREVSQRKPAHSSSTFNQTLKLAYILNNIAASNDVGISHGHRFVQDLHEWAIALPRQCQLGLAIKDLNSANICPLPHVLSLHLLHETTLAFLQIASRASQDTSIKLRTLSLLQCYSEMYGIIPPVFRITVAVVTCHSEKFQISQTQTNAQSDLDAITLQIHQAWTVSPTLVEDSQPPMGIENWSNEPLRRVESHATPNDRTSLPRPDNGRMIDAHYSFVDYPGQIEANSNSVNARHETPTNWNLRYGNADPVMTISSLLQSPNTSMPAYGPLDNRTMQAMPLEELDSMLDELAALDSSELANRQSQFLRNFGFGPEMTSADLGYIYGQQDMPNSGPDIG